MSEPSPNTTIIDIEDEHEANENNSDQPTNHPISNDIITSVLNDVTTNMADDPEAVAIKQEMVNQLPPQKVKCSCYTEVFDLEPLERYDIPLVQERHKMMKHMVAPTVWLNSLAIKHLRLLDKALQFLLRCKEKTVDEDLVVHSCEDYQELICFLGQYKWDFLKELDRLEKACKENILQEYRNERRAKRREEKKKRKEHRKSRIPTNQPEHNMVTEHSSTPITNPTPAIVPALSPILSPDGNANGTTSSMTESNPTGTKPARYKCLQNVVLPEGRELEKIVSHKVHNKRCKFQLKWQGLDTITEAPVEKILIFREQVKNYLDKVRSESKRKFNYLKNTYPEMFE